MVPHLLIPTNARAVMSVKSFKVKKLKISHIWHGWHCWCPVSEEHNNRASSGLSSGGGPVPKLKNIMRAAIRLCAATMYENPKHGGNAWSAVHLVGHQSKPGISSAGFQVVRSFISTIIDCGNEDGLEYQASKPARQPATIQPDCQPLAPVPPSPHQGTSSTSLNKIPSSEYGHVAAAPRSILLFFLLLLMMTLALS